MRTSASLVLSTAVSVSGLAFSNGQLGTAVDTTNSDFTVLSNEGNEAAVDEDSPFSIASDITMNDKCSNVGQGNVPFFLVNTQDPDEVVFLALEHLPGNLELYLTDLPWNGIALEEDLPNEGTIFMTIPKQGIEEGELFGLGPQVTYGDRWVKERGEFSLDTNGDNIFLYCKDSLNRIRFLSGFSNFGGWSSELESSYATNSSALPDSLVNSTITLPHMNNYHYNGERDTRISLLRQNIWNANLWTGSDLTRYEMGEVRKDDSAGVSISSVGSLGTALIVGAFASWVSFC